MHALTFKNHSTSMANTREYLLLINSFPSLPSKQNRAVGLPLVHDSGNMGRVQVRLAGSESDGAGEREAGRIGEASCGVGWDYDDAQEGGGVENRRKERAFVKEGEGVCLDVDGFGWSVCLCS